MTMPRQTPCAGAASLENASILVANSSRRSWNWRQLKDLGEDSYDEESSKLVLKNAEL